MFVSRVLTALFVIMAASSSLFAQNASVVGTAVDNSRAVLPGVTITAVEVTTGRQFVATTDERGEYRIPGMTPGRYKIQAELSGFRASASELELLVGQNATVDFALQVATLEESITVTGEAPLVDTRGSQVSGNVDRRQMEELPIQGRNWMELSMIVKGVTANTISNRPGVNEDAKFQLNLDGQEITQNHYNFVQAKISREAIAEYQIVTNLFDVTMGRSAGLQVQAISRAGTNNVTGSAYGYFRDDRFNAPDFVTDRVLPYSNQQVGGTLGGPILANRTHYFGSYEYEREPNTTVLSPAALTPQRLTVGSKNQSSTLLGRLDHDLASRGHLVGRITYFQQLNATGLSGGSFLTSKRREQYDSLIGSLNWSLAASNNVLHEVKVSYYRHHWNFRPADGVPLTPEYRFPGLVIGPRWNDPQDMNARMNPGVRYDLMWHRGAHELKIGGEAFRGGSKGYWPLRSRGQYFFSATPADIGRRFPLASGNDPTTWDLTGLDSLVLRFDQYAAAGDNWNLEVPRPTWAVWIGDTWRTNDRLTLNLGVRYDLAWGDLAPPGITENDIIINNGKFTENVGFRNDIRDLNNVAPRVGFAWNVTGDSRFVIRGGSGMFFGNVSATQALEHQLLNRLYSTSYVNDRQPGFLQNPTRGVTFNDYLSGRVPLPPQSPSPIAHNFVFPYTWQNILGFQKQLTEVLGVDADLVYWRGRNEDSQRDPNLFYDPATGLPKHPNTFGRPNPQYGPITLRESRGRSDYLALASSITRRQRDRYQVGVTYTLMFYKHDTGNASSGYGGTANNPFDPDADWARASDFQRHTLRVNGLYALPGGVSLAGLFRFGSGNYSSINAGVNPLGVGSSRIRANLSIIEPNTFKNDPHQSLDVRLSKEFRVVGDVRVTAMAEMFNLYNYARYSYNTLETSPTFGARQTSAGQPRSGQLALKVSF
jgi:hypothetical protein